VTNVEERERRTVIRARWLFDGCGSELMRDPVVVLEGERIVSVDRGIPPPLGARVVDLPGATLLPGLVDTHQHLVFDAGSDPVASLAARDDDGAREAMVEAARVAVRGGVTTVRDLGDRGYLSLGLRGRAGLPTIVAAGPPITSLGGHCHFLGGEVGPDVRSLRDAVRERVERGVDVIKVMASGGHLTPGSRQETSQFGFDELRAVVEEGHRYGLSVIAHAHGGSAIAEAAAAGVDGLEHVTFWTEDGVDAPAATIRAIAERRIVVGASLGLDGAVEVAVDPQWEVRIPAMLANFGRLVDAGVPLVPGTDAGVHPTKPHDVLRHAMPHLLMLGMSPAAALRAMTSAAADIVGLGHHKGRLAPGFDADILAVDGDPVADPTALNRIRAVYLRGTVVVPAGEEGRDHGATIPNSAGRT
jgi:imidazolonepropionase-like amidohydrolase